jgi:mannonate dehydratase
MVRVAGKLRVAIGQFSRLTEEMARFAKQLGFNSVQLNTPDLPGDDCWAVEDLLDLRNRCESYGLRLEAIENVPIRFMHKIMLGLEGRDEQIRNYRRLIRNIGKAGIPIFGHHFMPDGTWRTSYTHPLRGSARGMAFDLDRVRVNELDRTGNLVIARDPAHERLLSELVQKPIEAEQMWENYAYFIKAVLPEAEEAGVKLALHPADPPVEKIGGISRIFITVDDFKRAMEIADSDAWGINFCLGTFSSMAGGAANIYQAIEEFGPKGKIFCVHFRSVQGTVPRFNETFLGEGSFKPAEALKALKRAGFDGFMIDDHVPWIDDDTEWGHRSHAHQSGYLQGLIDALEE